MGSMDLKDFKQRCKMIEFLFYEDYSGCHTQHGMEGERDQLEGCRLVLCKQVTNTFMYYKEHNPDGFKSQLSRLLTF